MTGDETAPRDPTNPSGGSRVAVWGVVLAVVALVVVGAALVGRDPSSSSQSSSTTPGETPRAPGDAGEPDGSSEAAAPTPPTTGLFEKPVGRWLDVAAVDTTGRSLRTAEFVGSYLVVDFVFSSCAGTCPRLQGAMQELQEATRDARDLRMISVSVDPERDTPEVLRGWAEAWKADGDRWHFLRADGKDVRSLMSDGLKVGGGADLLVHSNLLLLIDPTGALRGRYEPLDHANWRDVLLADLAKLRAEAPAK